MWGSLKVGLHWVTIFLAIGSVVMFVLGLLSVERVATSLPI
jgi:hypothetical protein